MLTINYPQPSSGK